MSEPCIVCGNEAYDDSKVILCDLCQEKVDKGETNYVPCHKHEILHWRFDECPICGMIRRKRDLIGEPNVRNKKKKTGNPLYNF